MFRRLDTIFHRLVLNMGFKRRNMFYQNKKQETTEIGKKTGVLEGEYDVRWTLSSGSDQPDMKPSNEKGGGDRAMEKENASATADRDKDRTPNLIDAASIFGAYWPRPDGTNAANTNPLFGSYAGAYSGLLGRGAPGFSGANPYGTLSVAATQAANLGINPGAAWWTMASQLAAHDYLAAMQFAGLTPNMIPPYPLLPTPPHLPSSKASSHSKSTPSTPSSSATAATTPQPPVTNESLMGVRLPPDTEIIKYTSSMIGPKIPGTTNRGRKKTISLDVPHGILPSHKPKSVNDSMNVGLDLSARTKESITAEDLSCRFGSESNERVELIKLSHTNGRSSPQHGTGGSLLQDDGPLNLSLKPEPANNNNNTNSALQSLSTLSQNLGQSDRNRRKPGPKPRRVPPFPPSESPRPSSGSEENDSSGPHRDGRPRNLGRGVSKPKKNTVASLLAQSRALGIKPALELGQLANLSRDKDRDERGKSISPASCTTDHPQVMAAYRSLEELKSLCGDVISDEHSVHSHSEISDSSSESDGERKRDNSCHDGTGGKRRRIAIDEMKLREALEKGWKRETHITGVGRGGIKGEVVYTSPCGRSFKHCSDIVKFLEKQSSDLGRENFSFSCRILLGDYIESVQGKEPIRHSEETLAIKLSEMMVQHRVGLDHSRQERDKSALAAKEAKRLAKEEAARQREHLRILKEQERTERQEAARKEREQRNQQMLEGRKRLAFTSEEKWRIIREIESGKSKSDVSRELGLANSTVATIWKQRGNVMPTPGASPARKKKQEELERQRIENQQRKQQEREMKRQQTALLKEQMYMQELNKQREILYTVELERERRRQHMALVKALELRKRLEEREKKRLEQRAEKIATREKRMEQRRVEVEILRELRKPVEDMELNENKVMPVLDRIPGMKLSGKAFADTLMVHEFLHNFGETLGFDMESLPTLNSLQEALLGLNEEAEEELLSVITQLVICGIEDPGIPHPARHTTLLSHSLRQADISHSNLSEILRIYLYANATGELKAMTGVHFEREKEKRVTEHHNNMSENVEEPSGKNSAFFALLKENPTYKMSEWLKRRPFLSLNPTQKATILAFLCHELLQNKAVIKQIDSAIETVAQLKRERWPIEANLRKLRHLQNRKNKAAGLTPIKDQETTTDDFEAAEVESCNDSDITQPEEDELSKMNITETLAVVGKQAEVNTKALAVYSSQLRATCLGQDRYCRRYWCLSSGIYVEGMESAEPELFLESESNTVETEDVKTEEDVQDSDVKMEVDTDMEQLPPPVSQSPTPRPGDEESPPPDPQNNEDKMDCDESDSTTVKDEPLLNDSECKEEIAVKDEDGKESVHSEKLSTGKSLQFERLGECMEKESNTINGCFPGTNMDDVQWFSILPKEPCDSTSITSSQPGYRCWMDNSSGELRIPVLLAPSNSPSPCPSPLPIPLTAEEAALLQHCKEHGLPKPGIPKPIPTDLKRNWWKISQEKLMQVVANLEPRGLREREFMSSITRMRTDHTWEPTLKGCTSRDPALSELKHDPDEEPCPIPEPDGPDDWSQETALRVDLAALSQVESLEEKVASASMQLKGWKVPPKISTSDVPFVPACLATDPSVNPVEIGKDRLLQLQEAIEKRYLKPPLGNNTGDMKLNASSSSSQNNSCCDDMEVKGLVVWREALHKVHTAAQLAMVQHALEASIAWDKSIMKANCQFCHSGDNEDKLLLCDGCDKGYHTYCFRPKMETIPDGDWYCHQCLNQAKGEKNCIVCGKKTGRNLLVCEHCPVAYHTDCMTPPLPKVPRGKWYCSNCVSKHPKKKSTRRSQSTTMPLTPTTTTTTTTTSPIKTTDESTTNSTESIPMEENNSKEETKEVKRDKSQKRLNKELAPCRQVLDDLESHDEAWPFLLAVNTKQFPTYRKVIRNPMDLQTIGKRLSQNEYKSRDEFVSDVRLIFDNCETFNEDNSPVGKAGHTLRLFFETRWADLTSGKSQV